MNIKFTYNRTMHVYISLTNSNKFCHEKLRIALKKSYDDYTISHIFQRVFFNVA